MKKKNILAMLGIALIVVLVIVLAVISFFFGKENGEPASSSETTASSSESSSNSVEATPDNNVFEEIVFDTEPTMCGRSDYFEVTRIQKIKEMRMDYLDLVPLEDENGLPQKYYLGHQIYLSNTTGEQYIMSGETLLPISFTDDDNGYGYLREEGTARKIHIFGNSYDLEKFLADWDAGQRVLSGETTADEGSIIFDGQLTDYKYVKKGNDIYFNLAEITPLLTDFSYYDETMGYMDVYVNDCTYVRIPTSAANSYLQETMGVVENQFRFKSWNGEDFECWAPVLDAFEPLINIRDASMMFGWRMYTNGEVLSIVTDPLNVTNLAAVRDSGDMGLRIVVEKNDAGESVMRAYNTNGDLVWEKPFDESMVDDIEQQNANSSPQQILDENDIDIQVEDYIDNPQALEDVLNSLEENNG